MQQGQEATDQVVRITLMGAEVALRLTGSAVKNALPLILALLKGEKTAGKTRLVNLLKNSRDVQITDIKLTDYKDFKQQAGTMKLLYTAIKDKANGKAWIMTGSEELGRLNHVRQQMGYGTIDLSEYAKKNESPDIPPQNYSTKQEKSSETKNKSVQRPSTPTKESIKAKLEANKELLAKQAAKASVKVRTPTKGRG